MGIMEAVLIYGLSMVTGRTAVVPSPSFLGPDALSELILQPPHLFAGQAELQKQVPP